ncbi:MAG TPA: hypothetical protein VFK85_07760, partial [Anaeromyxobacteraceae bacterium]|nr:hypothetical protein [Anaeromyxobacteraceae bacterium]
MRALLVAMLINGLVPALGEAAEAVVHLAETGHLAHGIAGERDLGDLGAEHGCGGSEHRCVCCPNLPVAPAPAPATLARFEREPAKLSPSDQARPLARSL